MTVQIKCLYGCQFQDVCGVKSVRMDPTEFMELVADCHHYKQKEQEDGNERRAGLPAD